MRPAEFRGLARKDVVLLLLLFLFCYGEPIRKRELASKRKTM